MKDYPIAVLGGGNAAHGLAADLTRQGISVHLYEMPQFKENMAEVFATRKITLKGVYEGTFTIDVVTDDIDEALKGVKYIFVMTPAFAHEGYAKLLKGRVHKDQVIVTVPGAFAALQFRNILGEEDCPTFVDGNDLMYDVRLIGPGKVMIFEAANFDVAFMPTEREKDLLPELREIFDIPHTFDDVLACGLAIINPALHSGPCILNAGPIEYPNNDFYLYEHGFTPSAAKIDKQLDNERRAIAKAFGYEINPFRTFPLIDYVAESGKEFTWEDLYTSAHGDSALTPISGPNDIKSRYLTEDAPFGLVPWSKIGKLVGVDTTTIDSIVNLYSVFHEINWWEQGMGIDAMGLDESMTIEEIREYCRTGKK